MDVLAIVCVFFVSWFLFLFFKLGKIKSVIIWLLPRLDSVRTIDRCFCFGISASRTRRSFQHTAEALFQTQVEFFILFYFFFASDLNKFLLFLFLFMRRRRWSLLLWFCLFFVHLNGALSIDHLILLCPFLFYILQLNWKRKTERHNEQK